MISIRTESINKIFEEKISIHPEEKALYKEVFHKDYANISYVTKNIEEIDTQRLLELSVRPELLYRFLCTSLDQVDNNFLWNTFVMCIEELLEVKFLKLQKYYKPELQIVPLLENVLNNKDDKMSVDTLVKNMQIAYQNIETAKQKTKNKNELNIYLHEASMVFERLLLLFREGGVLIPEIVYHTTVMLMAIVSFSQITKKGIDVESNQYSILPQEAIALYKRINDRLINLAIVKH